MIQGFHNVTYKEYGFNNLTYLHGMNGAGKTTVIQAIQLALLGYIPGTDKNKTAIFKHSNGNVMRVTLTLDDETGVACTIDRTWVKANGGVNYSETIYPKVDLEEIIGDISLPVFHFNDFVGMTANKLKDWFIDFLPKSDVKIDWDQLFRESLSQNRSTNISEEFIDKTVEEVSKLDGKGVEQVRNANTYLKSCVSLKKDEVNRLNSTIQSMIFYDDIDTTTYSIDGVKKDLAYFSDVLNKLKQYEFYIEQKKSLEAKYAAILSAIPEEYTLEDLTAQYEEYKSRLEDISKHISDLEAQRIVKNAEISAQSKKLEECKAGICPITGESCLSITDDYKNGIELAIKKLKDDLDEIEVIYNRNCMTRDELNSSVLKQTEFIQNLRIKLKQKDSILSQIASLPKVEEYPKESKEFCETRIAELSDILTKLKANEMYQESIGKFNKLKIEADFELEAYKVWVELTGVNNLQIKINSDNPFKCIEDAMDKWLAYTLPGVKSEFMFAGKSNSFSFGIDREGSYIPYDLLSSGEKCLYALALLMSLISVSNTKLPLVIVDDMLDHLDDHKIQKLFESLNNTDNNIQMIFAGVKSVDGEFVKEVK